MQLRYCDRGRPYSHDAWRAIYKYSISSGVLAGFDLSPSLSSGTQITLAPGALALPTGIVVVETEDTVLDIGGAFPPTVATNYTVVTQHSEVNVGLIGGEAMTYYITTGLLSSQPSDGVILGWIRHPGSNLPLIQSYITNAPKYAPLDIAKDYVLRNSIHACPPLFVNSIGSTSGIFVSDGAATHSGVQRVYRGYENITVDTDPSTSAIPVVTCWYQFPVSARPYQISLESYIPVGDSIAVTVYDTAATSVATSTFTSHLSYTKDTVSIPAGTGTWTTGSFGVVKLVITVAKNTLVKLSDLEVNFWPYALSRV